MGKIYRIVCNITGEVYIGSTDRLDLDRRLAEHVSHSDREVISKQIIERGNYHIELIEEVICKTKEDLLWRERYWMEKTDCINVRRPIITKEEHKELISNWEKNNRTSRLEKQRKHRAYIRSWSFNKYLGTGLCLLDINPNLFQ
jgi:group I intron endonuclease